MIPPPEATTPLPAAVLPVTWLLMRVIFPWFTMPPPLVWLAVLLLTWVFFRTATPPFAMPPAAIGGPPSPQARYRGGGRVAVHLAAVQGEVAGARRYASGNVRLEMPPPFNEVLPFTWLLLTVTVPSRFWMPPRRRWGRVAGHPAVIEGQDAAGMEGECRCSRRWRSRPRQSPSRCSRSPG